MKKNFITIVAVALALSGCINSMTGDYVHQLPKDPVKLPYNFYLESFIDQRPVQQEPTLIDALSEREQLPFMENIFVKTLVRQVNGRTLYDYDDATLRVELKDYAAFKQKWNYTLSFYVDVTGFDEKGKVLTTGVFSCLVERNEAEAWLDALSNMLPNDQDPPQEDMKQKKVWDELYKECITDIAYQFNNKIVEWGRGKRS